MSQAFTITLTTAQVINSNHRPHPIVRAKKTKAIRELAHKTIITQGFNPMTRARGFCYLSFGDRRLRDPGNWYPTAKAAVDGFVGDAGLLPGDDSRYLIGPDMRLGEVGKRGLVRLTFVFEEEVE